MRGSLPGRIGPQLCVAVGLGGGCTEAEEVAPPGVVTSGAAARGPARRDERHKSTTVRDLETGLTTPQEHKPLDQLVLVLDVFHSAKRDVARAPEGGHQTQARLFCAQLNVDFMQCVVFDGSDVGAHLVGIEYVISAELHATLPQSEMQYWHAHVGEIDSGILIAPGLPEPAHNALMRELRSTYGKTWRTWDTTREMLPLGEPRLMWSIAPSKLDPTVRTEMRSRQASEKRR